MLPSLTSLPTPGSELGFCFAYPECFDVGMNGLPGREGLPLGPRRIQGIGDYPSSSNPSKTSSSKAVHWSSSNRHRLPRINTSGQQWNPHDNEEDEAEEEEGDDDDDGGHYHHHHHNRHRHRSNPSVSSAASIDSDLSPVSEDEVQFEASAPPTLQPRLRSLVRVKVRTLPPKRKPTLRHSPSPSGEQGSLRDILRRMQSDDDLRRLYEAQTLAYLNGAITF